MNVRPTLADEACQEIDGAYPSDGWTVALINSKTLRLYTVMNKCFSYRSGSTYADLRKESAEKIASTDMAGCAIGSLSVGEPAIMMYEMTALCCDILPTDKPRYLMGWEHQRTYWRTSPSALICLIV